MEIHGYGLELLECIALCRNASCLFASIGMTVLIICELNSHFTV